MKLILKIVLSIAIIIGIIIALINLLPVEYQAFKPENKNIYPYRHTLDIIEERNITKLSKLDLRCSDITLTHFGKTDNAILLLHGFTSCPQQLYRIGEMYYEIGYNVIIPRLNGHGYFEKTGNQLNKMEMTALQSRTNKYCDMAFALGDTVTVLGFSMGGALASWLSKTRYDIHKTVLISPSFIINGMKRNEVKSMINLGKIFKFINMPWPNDEYGNSTVADYSYYKFSLRSASELIKTGNIVSITAPQTRLNGNENVLILNPDDLAVNNNATLEIVSEWEKQGTNIEIYNLDGSTKIPHDYFAQPNIRFDRDSLLKIVFNYAVR